jgi:hypothetical protein
VTCKCQEAAFRIVKGYEYVYSVQRRLERKAWFGLTTETYWEYCSQHDTLEEAQRYIKKIAGLPMLFDAHGDMLQSR